MKKTAFPPSKLAGTILKIGLPLISAVFLYILFYVLNTPISERSWICSVSYEMLEYAVMSFTIILCGAILSDITFGKG